MTTIQRNQPLSTAADLPPCGYRLSSETYPSEQLILRLYLILPAICAGLIANVINIRVFAHASMRKSTTNWFLLALSVADTLLLISGFNMFILPVITEGSHSFWVHLAAQYLMRWFYPVSQLAQTASVYSVVAVSFHRFLGICHPFVAQRHCTTKSTKLVIGGVMGFAFIFTLPRWTGIILVECYSQTFNRTGSSMTPGPLYRSSVYSMTYSVAGYIVVMFLLPFCTLCVFDIQLIRAVKRSTELQKRTASNYLSLQLSSAAHQSLLPTILPAFGVSYMKPDNNVSSTTNLNWAREEGPRPDFVHNSLTQSSQSATSTMATKFPKISSSSNKSNNNNSSSTIMMKLSLNSHAVGSGNNRNGSLRTKTNMNGNNGNNITIMLITIVTLFLLCNILPFLNNILEHLMPMRSPAFRILVELGNFLVTCNSGAYIFIYYIFNSKYRQTFCQLLCGDGCFRTASSSSTPTSSSTKRTFKTKSPIATLMKPSPSPVSVGRMRGVVGAAAAANDHLKRQNNGNCCCDDQRHSEIIRGKERATANDHYQPKQQDQENNNGSAAKEIMMEGYYSSCCDEPHEKDSLHKQQQQQRQQDRKRNTAIGNGPSLTRAAGRPVLTNLIPLDLNEKQQLVIVADQV